MKKIFFIVLVCLFVGQIAYSINDESIGFIDDQFAREYSFLMRRVAEVDELMDRNDAMLYSMKRYRDNPSNPFDFCLYENITELEGYNQELADYVSKIHWAVSVRIRTIAH